ncbi:MAG: hypothetical protein PVH19_15435, partial [Planctomycetia bacterium]
MSSKPSNNPKDRLFELLAQIDDGPFSELSRAELNDLLRQHPELVHDFVEYREQCAALRIMHLQTNETPIEAPVFPAVGDDLSEESLSSRRPTYSGFSRVPRFVVSLLVLVAVTLGIG